MAAIGTATINFGAAPGTNTAQTVVTGVTTITSGSVVDAFIMYSSTTDHNAEEHLLTPLTLRCGSVVADTGSGGGFTIYAESTLRLTGTFNVHWVWV